MKRGLNFDMPAGAASSSSSNVDLSLTSAILMGSHVHPFRMPWELTSTLRAINSGDLTPWLNPPKIRRALPAVSDSVRPRKTVDNIKVKIEIIRITCQGIAFKRSDPDRAQAILKWLELILAHPSSSRVGQQLLAMDAGDACSDRCFMVISDSLQSKATATLHLRASSLALFTKWFTDNFPGRDFLPFSEENVYY